MILSGASGHKSAFAVFNDVDPVTHCTQYCQTMARTPLLQATETLVSGANRNDLVGRIWPPDREYDMPFFQHSSK